MAAPISTLRAVCAECGVVYERHTEQARCTECHPPQDRTVARIMAEDRRGSRQARGYGAAWERLSKRARRIQPWCSDCGRTTTLTADHSPEAWRRHDLGLTIRLQDIDVVCVICNGERGAARGPDALERPTIGARAAELAAIEDELIEDNMIEDDETMGMDERLARGEVE